MFRDIDHEFRLHALLQDVLGCHVHHALFGGGGHALLYDNDCTGNILLLHALAIPGQEGREYEHTMREREAGGAFQGSTNCLIILIPTLGSSGKNTNIWSVRINSDQSYHRHTL